MAHSPITDINRIKTMLVAIGTVALVFGAWMSYSFGAAMSFKHGVILALLTFVAAVMPTMIDYLAKCGQRSKAIALAIICAPFMFAEYGSHLGYTVGNRVSDVELTSVQNAKFDGRKQEVEEAKGTVKMFAERLATLTKERDAMISANPWAPTVSADGLRAQIATADEAIRQEEKRGGCGPKCLELKRSKSDLENRIATAERVASIGTEIAKLNTQIEASKRVIASAREKADNTEFKSSVVVNQTKFVSQLWTTSLEPGQDALTWTQIAIGALIALVTTFLAPVCYFMAFADAPAHTAVRYSAARRMPDIDGGALTGTSVPSVPSASSVLQPIVVNHTQTAPKDTGLQDFLANLTRAIDGAKTRAA